MSAEVNETISVNTSEITAKFTARLSLEGNMIDKSYLPVDMTDINATILAYVANRPKSSGVYKRVRTGLIKTGINCEIDVPVIKVSTLRKCSDWNLDFFNMRYIRCTRL